jgi:hypothetical protein
MKEKGPIQKLIDTGQCPRCRTAVDYDKEPAVCEVCKLKIGNATYFPDKK